MTSPAAMAPRLATVVFVVFVFAYFFLTLTRATTATLAHTLVTRIAVNTQDMSLLAGGLPFPITTSYC